MSAKEDFAEGRFKIECNEMLLTRAGGDPAVVRGPREIWQDDEGVLQYKIFADQPGYRALQAYMTRPRVVGQIIPDEDYFTLQAQEYSLPTWTADRVLPSCRGGLAHGLAYGYLHQLVRTDTYPKAAPSGFIRLLFRGKLEFPCNQGTETVIRVGGTEHHTSSTLNAAFVEDGAFRFDILHEREHTVATLELPADQLTSVTSNRVREALQFVLGQQLALMVIETTVGSQRVTRLTSPSRGHGEMPPPLRFHLVDDGGHVWRMFTTYFRHVHTSAKPGWHPISQHIGSAIQSTAATLEAQVLALAVAVEGLAADCFASLAPVSAEFLRELEAVATAIGGVTLSARTRDRINGMLDAMRRPRNSDIVRAFITNYRLEPGLYDSWSRLRQPAAHGGGTGGRGFEAILQLKHEVLSLLYSLVFAAINYTGPRTDYSLPGWPTRAWPILQPAGAATVPAPAPPQAPTTAPQPQTKPVPSSPANPAGR